MSDPLKYSTGISNYISNNKDKPSIDLINYTLGTSGITTYSNFYLPGKDPDMYAKELISGHSPAAMKPSILPGNRYFIDVKKPTVDSNEKMNLSKNQTCYDASGKPHNLSSLIDNIQKTKVITDSSNQGLLYSLYASLQDYDKGITNVDLSKNSHSCIPITAYIDGDGTAHKSGINFVLSSETEGFIDSAAYEKSSLSSTASVFVPTSVINSTPGFKAAFGSSIAEPPVTSPSPNVPAPTTSVINPITGKPMLAVPPAALNAKGDNIKTLQTMAKALEAINNGSTTAATMNAGTAELANDFADQFNKGGNNNFTTMTYETITFEKNPGEDPIFIFYVISLLVLIIYLGYRCYRKLKK